MKQVSQPESKKRSTSKTKRTKSGSCVTPPSSDAALILATATFHNGDPIAIIDLKNKWWANTKDKQAACCYYGNKKSGGMLYNFYALADSRGIAPNGYKIASASDFLGIIRSLCGNTAIEQAAGQARERNAALASLSNEEAIARSTSQHQFKPEDMDAQLKRLNLPISASGMRTPDGNYCFHGERGFFHSRIGNEECVGWCFDFEDNVITKLAPAIGAPEHHLGFGFSALCLHE
jgi:hypothetical protein